MLNLEEYINKLEHNNLSIDESFNLAVFANTLIGNNDLNGQKLIVNVLEQWSNIPEQTYELWTDVIELVGFYPYLEKNKSNLIFNNFTAEIRKELHLSSNLKDKYFHEEQLKALRILQNGKNLILSAPTSFGKSLLIEEVVASKKYNNIVIIQPTLALLDETRQKLSTYNDEYKLIIRTTQEPNIDGKNIFLFTAERVNEYQFFQKVDFLVIDEFYKLSGQRDDERSAFLNNAFYHLYRKYKPQFYLLGPNIDGISDGFTDEYNAVFYRTDYSLVDNRIIDVYMDHKGQFGVRGEKASYKENVLFELLFSLSNEQTIIYCSSPNRVKQLSKRFTEYLISKNENKNLCNLPLIEWIQENISEEWDLIDGLQYGIGIHDGGIQKHITSTIIDYFNSKQLNYIFCTSTIIEGVNTSTKNIVFFDPKKGLAKVDFFDYSNIKGRAGRMMLHYVGYIYNFNPPPSKINDYIVDVPFYQQNPIKDESLIQLEESDIKIKDSQQYKDILHIPEIDKEIIKNNGINVKGQVQLLKVMRRITRRCHHLIDWTTPSYQQLRFILTLANKYLMVKGETKCPVNINKLSTLTNIYAYQKSFKYLIENEFSYARKQEKNKEKSDKELYNEKIQLISQIVKHWIQYKIPKWLSVMNSLQELVCTEQGLSAGSYLYYATLLENEFLPDNLTILLEYGVPISAIHKLADKFNSDLSQDDVLSFIKNNQLHKNEKLLQYEQYKLEKLFTRR